MPRRAQQDCAPTVFGIWRDIACGTQCGFVSDVHVSSFATIRHLFISPGHNFFGRYGQPAGEHPVREVPAAQCRTGWGLEGDRFYGYRPDYKGQVTFFAWETFLAAREKFRVPALSPGAFRRNVITEGLDLNALIGRRFTLGGV